MAKVTVRLLTSVAGDRFSHAAGEEIELDSAEAKRFLESGQAEPVAKRAVAKAEKRVSKPAESR